MTLHPDVITDLVILYHAGEASQASRELLEKEAQQNPAIAAALAARPRIMQPIEAAPMIQEREVLKRVRQHYLYRALMAIGLVLALIAMFSLVRAYRPALGSSHVSGDSPSKNTKASPEPR
jgi:ferric-dicitrate binding protein FerR (iron transport regulator)